MVNNNQNLPNLSHLQPADIASLPEPDIAAISHSQQLIELIRQRIEARGNADQQGKISFAEYMELALMAPGLAA